MWAALAPKLRLASAADNGGSTHSSSVEALITTPCTVRGELDGYVADRDGNFDVHSRYSTEDMSPAIPTISRIEPAC
jgi:hypothetical protein